MGKTAKCCTIVGPIIFFTMATVRIVLRPRLDRDGSKPLASFVVKMSVWQRLLLQPGQFGLFQTAKTLAKYLFSFPQPRFLKSKVEGK